MSEIRNESLNIWGCDVVHILNNILNITIPIPQKNSLDHSWVELSWADDPSQWAVWRTGRGEGEWGLRWEKWRLGELVYWFPEPPSSSLLPPLLRGATSHTVPRPAPTAWLCSNQQTSFLSSHHHSVTAAVPPSPILCEIKQQFISNWQKGQQRATDCLLRMILLCT